MTRAPAFRVVLLAAALIAIAAIPARPYVIEKVGTEPVRWPSASATVHHDAATIKGAFVTELQAALAAWSNISGCRFKFNHGGVSRATNVMDSTNGSTDCYFDPSLTYYAYAVTMVNYQTTADIKERDVAFNGKLTWKTSGTSSDPDFRTVAIHELGHVVGLMHESTNVSVMNVTGWDPQYARHSLEADDMNAMRYLYPTTDPNPNPGPAPTADVTITTVTVDPEEAGPGDRVTIGYTVRNDGTVDAGTFKVGTYLTGALVPSTKDRFLGSKTEYGLAAGASRARTIEADVPTGLPPGHYRYGVLADIRGDVEEHFETNNGNATLPLLDIDRAALEVGPGQIIRGDLGPLGEDRFRIHLPEKASLRIRAFQEPGSLSLDMTRVGTELKLIETGLTRAAREKLKIVTAAEHEIVLTSSSANESEYELQLKVKLKSIRASEIVDGELRIPFRVWKGCTVKVSVAGKKKFVPVAEIEDLEVPVVARKTKVKLGPWTATEHAERVLVIRPGPDVQAGQGNLVKYKIRVKPPAEETVVSR